ncbi:hypothetical protein AFB00_03445 [Pseudonocardia sp. HH130630-07]|nr:hypothetical protein AFB00_03445 [Pseudonocardia sp. HH130630-07]
MGDTATVAANGAGRLGDHGSSFEYLRPLVDSGRYVDPNQYSWIQRAGDNISESWQSLWGNGADHVTIAERNAATDAEVDRAFTRYENDTFDINERFTTASAPPAPGGSGVPGGAGGIGGPGGAGAGGIGGVSSGGPAAGGGGGTADAPGAGPVAPPSPGGGLPDGGGAPALGPAAVGGAPGPAGAAETGPGGGGPALRPTDAGPGGGTANGTGSGSGAAAGGPAPNGTGTGTGGAGMVGGAPGSGVRAPGADRVPGAGSRVPGPAADRIRSDLGTRFGDTARRQQLLNQPGPTAPFGRGTVGGATPGAGRGALFGGGGTGWGGPGAGGGVWAPEPRTGLPRAGFAEGQPVRPGDPATGRGAGGGQPGGYGPMMGGAGAGTSGGQEHRNRYIVPTTEFFDLDLEVTDAVLGPDDTPR